MSIGAESGEKCSDLEKNLVLPMEKSKRGKVGFEPPVKRAKIQENGTMYYPMIASVMSNV